MLQIGILALDGCATSAVTGLSECLALANQLHSDRLFHTTSVSIGSHQVQGYGGTRIICDEIVPSKPNQQFDMLLIPPQLDLLEEQLARREVTETLTAFHQEGCQISSVCAGAFFLASTGQLNGRVATTHWQLAERFQQLFPQVKLQAHRMLIDGGDYICCGGVSAWMDLALYLISQHGGQALAQQCGRMMLFDLHRDYQTPYGSGGFRTNHGDDTIIELQHYMEGHYHLTLTIEQMAKVIHQSPRTMQRRFKSPPARRPTPTYSDYALIKRKAYLSTAPTPLNRLPTQSGIKT